MHIIMINVFKKVMVKTFATELKELNINKPTEEYEQFRMEVDEENWEWMSKKTGYPVEYLKTSMGWPE